MKICIYGAGAIGGWIGTRIAQTVSPVSVVARGATAAAIRTNGLRLHMDGKEASAKVNVAENPAELGVQDVVVIAVKGPAMGDIAANIAPLLGSGTMVLSAMNGVPWWFFENFGGPVSGITLQSIDVGGKIAAAIPADRVIGGVVHATCSTPEPGVVKHGFGNKIILGAANVNPQTLKRTEALSALLIEAGFDAPIVPTIQRDIWYKLWGNMTMNPLSALTGATCDLLIDDPLIKRFCLDAMSEAAEIGKRIGCPIEQSGEARMALTRQLGAFKTSMLQDSEANRAMEINNLVTAVHEIGLTLNLPTPNIDALLGLIRLMATRRGLMG